MLDKQNSEWGGGGGEGKITFPASSSHDILAS